MFAQRAARRSKTVARNRKLIMEALETRRVMAWTPAGPFSATNGQVEGIANRPVSGALHALLAHPTNADILYAGSVNGGVWRTTNATAASPNWTPLTDTQSSQSIGALAFDAADPTFQTIWAGNAGYSSYASINAGRDGLLKSNDGGNTWTRVTGGGLLVGKSISGIVANGNVITVSVNIADSFTFGNIGIFRSNNGGTTFTKVSGGVGSGMPEGVSYDLEATESDPSIMYTSSVFETVPGTMGVYKSVNGGANWSRVSTPAMNALFTTNTSNVEIATGIGGIVYVAIVNAGNLAGLFRSADGGSSWTAMDLPVTNETGGPVGLNPRGFSGPLSGTPEEIAGGQGAIHFSIVADPVDPNIVYVGGDRQPRGFQDAGSFPNAIGANDFSGRLFRGDASKPAGTQFVHLTHRNDRAPAGGGTTSNSSPHADSRDMVFRADGVLVESDDGGVYRRTSPRTNTGDWFSMNGDLQITEAHDVAYDNVSNILLTGNQDTGTTQQSVSGATIWDSVSTGDGGDVAVDTLELAANNQSVRYTSFQNLGAFRRTVYDATGTPVGLSFPTVNVTSGNPFSPFFRTPIATNNVVGRRLLIQGNNSLYESTNQTSSLNLVEIGTGRGTGALDQDALVYGGRLNGVDNPNVVWAGSGSNVLFRSGPGGVSLTPAQPTTSVIRDIVADPEAYTSATLVTATAIFRTTNSGANWTNITGNLSSLTSDFRTIQFVPGVLGSLAVGTERGVFVASLAEPSVWVKLSTNLPNVVLSELDYDATDDVLVAGTMGRGVWTLNNVQATIDAALPPFDFGDAPSSYLVTSAQNGARHGRIGPTLGTLRDAEVDGAPSATATGDNNVGSADEDGVLFTGFSTAGGQISATVTAPLGGVLNAWADFDQNGTFDPSERAVSELSLSVGANNISIPTPANAKAGNTFMRFRLTSATGQATTATGAAPNGEVEDYPIQIFGNVISSLPFYRGTFYETSGGQAGATDTAITALKAAATAVPVTTDNVTSNLQGINGMVLSISGLTATTLTAADFNFRMSPQGAYNEATNPPSSWQAAPAPRAISVTAGSPATVRLEWDDNLIENRYLQVQVKANANTGLGAAQAFYLGHLKGDVDMQAIGGILTVLNADIAAAQPSGAVGTVGSRRDVDKNGFVLTSDLIQIRNSINQNLALRLITLPAAGSANEGAPGFAPLQFSAPRAGANEGVNTPPLISANLASVSGNEGTVISNAGTWSDIDLDNVTLSASAGTIVKNANGTWNWSITPPDNVASTQVTVTADDGRGGISTAQFNYSASNVAPTVARNLATVSGNVLTTIVNTGTWSDVAADNVVLTASAGTVVKNANGTWSWSITPASAINNQTVTITATDKDGASATADFSLSALVAVPSGQVYYKGSTFANTSVAAALDGTKSLAKAGPGTLTLTAANMINAARGINGLVFDVAGLASTALVASDFTFRISPQGTFDSQVVTPATWAAAPTPTTIAVTPGNATTPARVRLEWVDNAIENRWLQISVLATANTGLATPQTFYIGHLRGDIDGVVDGNGQYTVQNADLTAAMPGGSIATVNSARDIDKNGYVLTSDLIQIRQAINANLLLSNITIPAAGSAAEAPPSQGSGQLIGEGEAAPEISSIKLRSTLVDEYFADL